MSKLIVVNPGDLFGSLTVLEELPPKQIAPSPSRPKGRALRQFALECSCENKTYVEATLQDLRSENTQSCGCVRGTHRRAKTREYRTWSEIIQRCHNPKSTAYPYYGAKGVTVCDRWRESFESFLEDMGEKPSPDHSIDRVETTGNYDPENCRWATRKEQDQNKRNTRRIKFLGRTECLAEWARILGIPYSSLLLRCNNGTDHELMMQRYQVLTKCNQAPF